MESLDVARINGHGRQFTEMHDIVSMTSTKKAGNVSVTVSVGKTKVICESNFEATKTDPELCTLI